jgi:arginine decarboxylase-like protein
VLQQEPDRSKGFEIVSVSIDERPELVARFRKEKWKMPWMNAFVKDTEAKSIAKDFEQTLSRYTYLEE